jgi:carbon storage regulator
MANAYVANGGMSLIRRALVRGVCMCAEEPFGLCLAQQAHPRGLRVADPERQGPSMLVLTRKSNQSIMIGDDVEVTVLSVMGDKVRIGIQAPGDVPVFRTEIYLEIRRGQREEADRDHKDTSAEVDDALRELGGGGSAQ